MGIKITGWSDDLIEIEGDIDEEFYAYNDKNYLAVSDGTLLSIVYDDNGIWRIYCLVPGTSHFRKDIGDISEDTFDIVYLEDEDIKWVVLGENFSIRGKKQDRR